MKIALLGYGKMGRLCESQAKNRGHQITAIVTATTPPQNMWDALKASDVFIDFSHPNCAVDHIKLAASLKKDIVVGTTGWYEYVPEIKDFIKSSGIGCVYSPNFSLSMRHFKSMISKAAKFFGPDAYYDVAIVETHHKHKVDQPSGTAKDLACVVSSSSGTQPAISSIRIGNEVGTHTVMFSNPSNKIQLTHIVTDRNEFAHGAVLAAEWIKGKSGLFSEWIEEIS